MSENGAGETFYPLFLRVRGRRCVVVGGGEVARRKVKALLEAGAQVTVVSPQVSRGLARMAVASALQVISRPYQAGDLEGALLAIAATDDRQLNQAVAREAEEKGILVNVVDQPARCSFIAPSVARQGPLTIAISTGGRSPAVARKLREELERGLLPDYAALLDLAAEIRQELHRKRAKVPPTHWQRCFTAELLSDLREGKRPQARARLLSLLLAGCDADSSSGR